MQDLSDIAVMLRADRFHRARQQRQFRHVLLGLFHFFPVFPALLDLGPHALRDRVAVQLLQLGAGLLRFLLRDPQFFQRGRQLFARALRDAGLRHLQLFGGQARHRLHPGVPLPLVSLLRGVIGVHPGLLSAAQADLPALPFQVPQGGLGGVIFRAQLFHLLVIIHNAGGQQAVALPDLLAGLGIHAAHGDGNVLRQVQLDLIRLVQVYLSRQLRDSLKLSLFGGGKTDLGGRDRPDRSGKEHAQGHHYGQNDHRGQSFLLHRRVSSYFNSVSCNPDRMSSWKNR